MSYSLMDVSVMRYSMEYSMPPTVTLTYPVRSSSRENIAYDSSTISAATDAKAKSVAVIGQNNHLDLSPVTL